METAETLDIRTFVEHLLRAGPKTMVVKEVPALMILTALWSLLLWWTVMLREAGRQNSKSEGSGIRSVQGSDKQMALSIQAFKIRNRPPFPSRHTAGSSEAVI